MHMRIAAAFTFLVLAMTTPVIAGTSVTGSMGGFLFDGTDHYRARPVYSLRAGYDTVYSDGSYGLGVEGGFSYIQTHSTQLPNKADVYLFRVDALAPFLQTRRVVPFLAVGAGGMIIDNKWTEVPDSHDALVDYGLGMKVFVTDGVALRGDVRHLLLFRNDIRNSVECSLGLTLAFGKRGGEAPAPAPRAEERVKATPAPAPKPAPAPAPAPPAPPAPAPEKRVEPPAPAPAPPQVKKELPPPVVPQKEERRPSAVGSVNGIVVHRDGADIFVSGTPDGFKVFTLSKPARLVIDVANARNAMAVKMIPVNALGISDIRIGTYPDKVRIVFDASGDRVPAYRTLKTPDSIRVIFVK